MDNKEFKGNCMGVKLTQRGDQDKHVMVNVLIEDDEHWHETDLNISSYWLDELIEQLQNAKRFLETKCVEDKVGNNVWGYKFK